MAEYRGKKKQKEEGLNESAIVEAVFGAIFNLLKMIFLGLYNLLRGGKGTSSGNGVVRQQLQDGWERVEMHLTQEATLALAVSEADKVLDAALQYKGVAGTTMGERLKNASKVFPHDLYQQVWEAHKLRNTLAHEVGAHMNSHEAKQAVSSFRTAMYHLGIL